MPVKNAYKPPLLLRGQHLETIVPALLRHPKKITPQPEKITTPDDDFLQLDWYRTGSPALAIISHGLEGSSDRAYMKGMAKIFTDHKIDALCWNYRGCGSEMNRRPILYHSGATYDLDTVVDHALAQGYKEIVLIGFSLGGNITLKYAGEQGNNLQQKRVKAVIAFSVPLDLDAGCRQISTPANFLYARRFIKNLKIKIRQKHRQFPDKIPLNGLDKIKDLRTFDDTYTGPLHGFKNASDYYQQCSSSRFLATIKVPTLIVNALNDPFLPAECYPVAEAGQNRLITFETPAHGGHVGFTAYNKQGYYWSEQRALTFARQHLGLTGRLTKQG